MITTLSTNIRYKANQHNLKITKTCEANMKHLNRTIMLAGASHISTMIIGLFWVLFLAEDQSIVPVNPVGVSIGDSMLIVLFPWIVTGVALFSTIMADPNRSDSSQNTSSIVIWRWRSYSWGAAIIMIIFIFLSFETTSWFYLPTSILSIVTALLNK